MCAVLSKFLLDEDDDDDDWGKSRYKRQGLLQDLGVLDMLVQLIHGPIEKLDQNDLRKNGFPEFINTGSGSMALGMWEQVFEALKNSAEGDETATDRYIARHHEVFLKHSMYLKTEGAAEVLVELYQDNRDVLDDLLDDPASFGWIVNHLDEIEKAHQDFIDHDFYDFLATTCVCKGLAVQRAQNAIYEKISELQNDGNLLLEHGHFCKLSLSSDAHNPSKLMVQFNTKEGPVALSSMLSEIVATQESKVQTYYEAPPPVYDLRLKFLCSNLNFCAQLCQGHSRQQVAFVETVMPKASLLAVMQTTQLPYDLRAKAVQVLFEVYLDTAGALTILSGTTTDNVLPWRKDSSKHISHTLNKSRGLNGEEISYASLNENRSVYAKELHAWLVLKQGNRGFQSDLRKFTDEMKRIIAADDEFEEWHNGHGMFIIEVLQSTYLLVESGYYLQWDRIKEVSTCC